MTKGFEDIVNQDRSPTAGFDDILVSSDVSPLLADPFATSQTPGFEKGADVPIPTRQIPDPTRPRLPADLEGMPEFQRRSQEALAVGLIAKEENKRRSLAEIKNKLGIDPTGLKGGPEFDEQNVFGRDMDEFLVRADFMRSDKPSEIFFKFKSKFPEGNMKFIKTGDGRTVSVFRMNDKDPWKLVDPQGMEAMAALADAAGVIVNESTALELGTAFLTGGSSVAVRMIAQGLAAGIGQEMQSGVEQFRGAEDTPQTEVAKQAVMTAAFGAVAEKIFTFRKRFDVDQDFLPELQKFLRDEGIPEVMIGQVSRSPIVKAMFQQARSSTSAGDVKIKQQVQGLLKSLESRADGTDITGGTLIEDTLSLAQARIQKDAGDKVLKTGARELGEVTEKVILDWDKVTRDGLDKLYAGADALRNDVVFDIGAVKDLARKFLSGTRAPAGTGVRDVDPVGGEFRRLLDDIANIDNIIRKTPGTDPPYTVIKDLRTRAFYLTQPDVPSQGRFRARAIQIHKELTEAMKNPFAPKGGDLAKTKEWKDLWEKANDGWAKYESDLSNLFVEQIIKASKIQGSDYAVQASKQLFTNDNPSLTNLVMNRAAKTQGGVQALKDAYVTSLMREPATIRKTLDALKSPAAQSNLRRLLSAKELTALRNFGKQSEALAKSGFQRSLTRFETGPKAWRTAFKNSEISQLKTIVDGKFNSEAAKGLRIGFYSDLLDKSVKIKDGERILDPRILAKNVQSAIEEGKIFTFMEPTEIKNIVQNMGTAASIFAGAMDVGGAIRRGAIVGGIRSGKVFRTIGAAQALASDRMTLAVLASPAGSAFMKRANNEALFQPGTAQAIRLAGILMASAVGHVTANKGALNEFEASFEDIKRAQGRK